MRVEQVWERLLLLLTFGLVFGCGMRKGDAATTTERVNLYKTLSSQLKADPSTAMKPLTKLAKDESNNAMPHYLLAAANAKLGKWAEALQEVETGNGAKSCTYPISEIIYEQNYLGIVALRQFVKDAPTSGLDGASQYSLLVALRNMGGRIATGEPCNLTVALVGAGFRRQASHPLVELLQRSGRSNEATKMESVEAEDERWRKTVKQAFDHFFDSGGTLNADKMLQKYGLTSEDAKAIDSGQTPSAETRDKMMKLSAEVTEAEKR